MMVQPFNRAKGGEHTKPACMTASDPDDFRVLRAG